MPVSRLASESDIQGTDILTTAAATLIRTTDTTDRATTATTVGRHFIGITDTECTIRATIDTIITGAGTKPRAAKIFQGRRVNSRRLYFFGELEAAGADVTDGEGS